MHGMLWKLQQYYTTHNSIEKQLYWFIYLREKGVRYQTVKSYLAAVRHMQISNDMGDPKIGTMRTSS